jgi:hypothetical protein
MIRNPDQLSPETLNDADVSTDVKKYRQRLATGDPKTIEDALRLLRTEGASRAWYIFEGPTYPDVYLVARDALVVIEGKRTEPGPTVNTKWLSGRHQIWRHLDAAWELRARRAVYGLFIVESNSTDGSVPEVWRKAGQECPHLSALLASLPHRSAEEVIAISRCYLGVTTWRKVCERFHIDWGTLPREVPNPGS